MFEMLTGKRPYHDLNSVLAMYRMVKDEHPPFPEINISPECKDFLSKCWQKDWQSVT